MMGEMAKLRLGVQVRALGSARGRRAFFDDPSRARFSSLPLNTPENSSSLVGGLEAANGLSTICSRYHLDVVTNQFLVIVSPLWRLSKLKKLVSLQFSRLYPEDSLEILYLRDRNNLDLDDDFLVMEVFENNDHVQVIRAGSQLGDEDGDDFPPAETLDFGKLFDDGGVRFVAPEPVKNTTPPDSDEESDVEHKEALSTSQSPTAPVSGETAAAPGSSESQASAPKEPPVVPVASPTPVPKPFQSPVTLPPSVPVAQLSVPQPAVQPLPSSGSDLTESSESEASDDEQTHKRILSIPSLKTLQMNKIPINPSAIVRKKEPRPQELSRDQVLRPKKPKPAHLANQLDPKTR